MTLTPAKNGVIHNAGPTDSDFRFVPKSEVPKKKKKKKSSRPGPETELVKTYRNVVREGVISVTITKDARVSHRHGRSRDGVTSHHHRHVIFCCEVPVNL